MTHHKHYLSHETIDQSRRLRLNSTDVETLLWQHLRNRRLGVKFRRQHPVGGYVADFACEEARLIIELDGGQHNDPAHQAYDAKRTAHLAESGWRVLRFWNNDVMENIEGVVTSIHHALTRHHEG